MDRSPFRCNNIERRIRTGQFRRTVSRIEQYSGWHVLQHGGCHVGNPVDEGQGGVRIEGLPLTWSPNTVYNLVVVVERPTALRFGFQLAAVFPSTGTQAGTLASVEPIVSVVNYLGVQFVQHFDAPVGLARRDFRVSWRSPESTAFGDVDFYVAGNAANNDMARTGDAIYFNNVRVSPLIPMLSSRSYLLPSLGGLSLQTTGDPTAAQVGYAKIAPVSNSISPNGVAIFGFRSQNILVSEAGVPASPLMIAGRIYAEISADATVNTGIAFANPNAQSATIRFYFTDAGGTTSPTFTTLIPPFGQVAKFLTEAPFSRTTLQGTFSFSSDIRVSVIALRGFTNQRSEFLITTLPVLDLSSLPAGTQLLSHFADGNGWTTQVILVNPSDSVLIGTVQFVGQSGDVTNNSSYVIPPRSSRKFSTLGLGATTLSGSVRVMSSAGSPAPAASAVFSYKPPASGITVSEEGISSVIGRNFRLYVEALNNIQTGIALANAGTVSSDVTLELYRLDGSAAGLTTTLNLQAAGQTAKFLGEIFPTIPSGFQGLLRISAASSDISVVGLRGRSNERSDFLITTTPAALESNAPGPELMFPHIVDGGGYTTQFVLFGSTPNQTNTGVVRFYAQNGSALGLPTAP